MSDLYDPRRPAGMPILGLSLSDRDRDFWDDLGSRSTLRGATADLGLFPASDDDACLALLPGRATCSRTDGHPGRHIALLGTHPHRRTVCSAWPGAHRPTVADLED